MTLTISIFVRHQDSRVISDDLVLPAERMLAGFEESRRALWASAAVISRGATMLPQLASADLWVEPNELDSFERECRVLLADVVAIADESGHDPGFVRFRLENFIHATTVARTRVAGVSIS